DSRIKMINLERGQTAYPARFRIDAEHPERTVRERGTRTPGFLAGQQPSALGPDRAAGQCGDVAARFRFRPGLRPDLLAACYSGQDTIELLLRPVREQGRGEHEDAVLADPARRPGRVVLLLEQHPLQ